MKILRYDTCSASEWLSAAISVVFTRERPQEERIHISVEPAVRDASDRKSSAEKSLLGNWMVPSVKPFSDSSSYEGIFVF